MLSPEIQNLYGPLGLDMTCVFHLQISVISKRSKGGRRKVIYYHIAKVKAFFSFESILSVNHDC